MPVTVEMEHAGAASSPERSYIPDTFAREHRPGSESGFEGLSQVWRQRFAKV